MLQSALYNTPVRRTFGKTETIAELPNLVEVQINSYNEFLQTKTTPTTRKNYGLHEVFKSSFPIEDYSKTSYLEYITYRIEEPKYDVEECIQRGISFSGALKVMLRLVVWDVDEETKTKDIKGIKEQEVYLGDLPLMTNNGTFIFNGTERVVVSQMHRSPGVFFDHDAGKTHSSGKYLYTARIIPYRGSWLDFEFDPKDLIYFRIDRRRKLYVSTLLRALGMTTQEIFDVFYKKMEVRQHKKGWVIKFNPDRYKGVKLNFDLVDAKTGKVALEAGKKLTSRIGKKLIEDGLVEQIVSDSELYGFCLAEEIKDGKKSIAPTGSELSKEVLAKIMKLELSQFHVLDIDNATAGLYVRNTILADKNETQEEALAEIYRIMRPGEPATFEASLALFNGLFFDRAKYDLSNVGRVKMNARLGLSFDEETRILTKEDIVRILQILVELKNGLGEIDDIDHLGNRRVRSVGELMENQLRIALVRMQRAIVERMSAVDIDTVMPHDLINSKLLASVVREFFGSSQLSQFMDQTNPLSEVTHKRRLSALGPGGLSRDTASFEVRDVHPTHYGRICPIETPEGQNIGLINSLSTYARINKYGFIETPYRKVVGGQVQKEIIYMSAVDEGKHTIAPTSVNIDSKGKITDELVSCRRNADFIMVQPAEVDYIDISPMQLVSVATSLIPFLENDDANRALMGSNMQRQAVPLIHADAPLVGTGIEATVARDSGTVTIARRDGVVDMVDSNRIVIKSKSNSQDETPGVDIYNLMKYQRTNHNTCINQKPLVKVGDEVKKGDVMADGSCTDHGELALGRNVLCAFLPWNGYNFEDSILISERIVKDDIFTSIHIEEFEVVARDTRLGPEEITRDIPNIAEENLHHLDEVGIVHVGAEVQAGDILVGKVTPKSESPMTPEEKLLRAIFGEKAADVRDSSLRLPPGISGTVVEVRIFSRRGVEKDERALSIERQEIDRLTKDREDETRIIDNFTYERLRELLQGKVAIAGPKGFKLNSEISKAALEKHSRGQYWQFAVAEDSIMSEISHLKKQYDESIERVNAHFNSKIEKLRGGDDLPQGALKVVKVFVAMKHKLQPGDKMAGRHGNKGVISKILPAEDMPYLEDGTPVDIVLNPLGVPSRMNIGQILETHLGWASVNLGKQIKKMVDDYSKASKKIESLRDYLSKIYDKEKYLKEIKKMDDEQLLAFAKSLTRKGVPFNTPVFDGAKGEEIAAMLEHAGLDRSGQVQLFDGRTGEAFDRKTTVGYNYMLKLHHLVDDKIHARSIGPYSLVTQQPLGGKSHMGGQRFGEMECWALQAYGAAYTLQEMLTVKSDDVTGRIKIYESIVRGDNNFESGIPESFNVMLKELRSLCLNVDLKQDNE